MLCRILLLSLGNQVELGKKGSHGETRTEVQTHITNEMAQGGAVATETAALDLLVPGGDYGRGSLSGEAMSSLLCVICGQI